VGRSLQEKKYQGTGKEAKKPSQPRASALSKDDPGKKEGKRTWQRESGRAYIGLKGKAKAFQPDATCGEGGCRGMGHKKGKDRDTKGGEVGGGPWENKQHWGAGFPCRGNDDRGRRAFRPLHKTRRSKGLIGTEGGSRGSSRESS